MDKFINIPIDVNVNDENVNIAVIISLLNDLNENVYNMVIL